MILTHVLNDYVVQKNAIALLPAKSMEYHTIVLTTDKKLYIKLTPFEIIKNSCLQEFATYEGRKRAIQQLTNFKNKVPIPINTSQDIFGFPTSSPIKDDCIWLFYHHIKELEDNHKNGSVKGKAKSTVHFLNNTLLPLDISYFILHQQYYKTTVCKNMFDSKA